MHRRRGGKTPIPNTSQRATPVQPSPVEVPVTPKKIRPCRKNRKKIS